MKNKLRQLIKESINKSLNELINEISIDMLKQQFVDTGKIDDSTFQDILKVTKNKPAIATWLLSRVGGTKNVKASIKPEDVYKWEEYLDIFNRYKQEYPKQDINQYKDPMDVFQLIRLTLQIKNREQKDASSIKGISKLDKYAKYKIGEVDGFTVYKLPKGSTDLYNTSCELGSGTEWCTATGNTREWFDEYINQGPLYIFDNGKGEKYQFHYESNQFMNKDDESVI